MFPPMGKIQHLFCSGHSGEDSDNENDYHQLNKCETSAFSHSVYPKNTDRSLI